VQFRHLLWVKIREPKIISQYHPNILENLNNEDIDLVDFLDKWL
jgi:hypothetical protein